jgi:serine protease Do
MVLSFAPVVKKAAPSVVNIFSKRVVKQRRLTSPLFDDPFFKRFFGDSFGGAPRERMESSLGSGVIVSGDGLVVTNHHVIKGATETTVVLPDRREFDAELVLSDERTDLAVLRIDPRGAALPAIELKNSDEVEVGDLVLALGNPFGVGQTVTSGIVSALARTQVGITDFSFFIQTDAAINPGNSGGALVTLDGKLIGINTAIYSRSGGSIGIGFAIPSNMVRTVIDGAARGDLVRAWSGLSGQTLTSDLAEGLRLARPGGVVVNKIYPSGPAAQAGLVLGDVILSVNDQPVQDLESLRFRVATQQIGGRVALGVLRGTDQMELLLPVSAPPEEPPRNELKLRGAHPLAGAVVASMSPALSEELDLPGTWEGVIISKVKRGATAHRVGFRPGDIILAVNRQPFNRSEALALALEEPPSPNGWRITFNRRGDIKTVEFQ